MFRLMNLMAIAGCLLLLLTGTAHAQRFQDNNDGTVTDNQTKLVWTKNANLFGHQNWHDSKNSCSTAGIAGSGWRMPTADELSAVIVAVQSENPFDNFPPHQPYWSSTEDPDDPNQARFVHSTSGIAPLAVKTLKFLAWPVR